ncbi:MAG TPA: hypothetical protein VGQ52_02515 [Gemmatimonadaceae bacterium]|nr:hypothetical protein [Gemmatimonadaceae bacterium]
MYLRRVVSLRDGVIVRVLPETFLVGRIAQDVPHAFEVTNRTLGVTLCWTRVAFPPRIVASSV